MELWILVAVAFVALLALLYVFYRVLLRIEHALLDMQTTSRATAEYSYSTASQATQTSANIKYFIELHEARSGYHDELRRQELLRQVRLEQLSRQDTPMPVTPVTPQPGTWLGNEAMIAYRRAQERPR